MPDSRMVHHRGMKSPTEFTNKEGINELYRNSPSVPALFGLIVCDKSDELYQFETKHI